MFDMVLDLPLLFQGQILKFFQVSILEIPWFCNSKILQISFNKKFHGTLDFLVILIQT